MKIEGLVADKQEELEQREGGLAALYPIQPTPYAAYSCRRTNSQAQGRFMFKEQEDPGGWLALASFSRTSAGHWRSFTSAVGRSNVVGVCGNTRLILCLNEKKASKF